MKQTFFRGRTITDDDVIQAMKCFDKERRESFPEKRWKRYAIEYENKNYPPKEIMRLVTGMQDVGSGGNYVNSPFQNLGFTIVPLENNQMSANDSDLLD